MKYSEVRDAIANIINTSLAGVGRSNKVIKANLNKPRPPVPYIAFNILIFNKVGTGHRLAADGTGDAPVYIVEDFNVSVQGYGAGSDDILQDVKDSFEKESIKNVITSKGLTTRNYSNITDISTGVDSNREQRFLFEFTGGFGKTISDITGYFDNVEITGEVTPPDGVQKDITINVP